MTDIVERLRKAKPDEHCNDSLCDEAADTIATLRAEVERLKVQNIQMQAALGYGILAEDERHIIPSNPYKCGTCDASRHLRATNERLVKALEMISSGWETPPMECMTSRALAKFMWKTATTALAQEKPNDR